MVAVWTLAVGLGANTAIYSVVQAVMLHPLPFPEPERLVQIWETAERDELELRSLSFPVLEDMRGAQDVFESVAGSFQIPLSLGGSTEPERIMGEGVSPSYFLMLGATTLRRRFFTDGEDREDANHPTSSRARCAAKSRRECSSISATPMVSCRALRLPRAPSLTARAPVELGALSAHNPPRRRHT